MPGLPPLPAALRERRGFWDFILSALEARQLQSEALVLSGCPGFVQVVICSEMYLEA